MPFHIKQIGMLAMVLAVGCQPGDRDRDLEADRDAASDTVPTVAAQTHRQHVQDAMRDTRARHETLGTRISERSEDTWDRLSNRASETWREIESGLAGVRDDDPQTIHRNREESARRLAELEGEMAEEEVRATRTPEELREVAGEWFGRLESDLARVEQGLLGQDQPWQLDLDRDDVRDLRERLGEVRVEAETAPPARDDFEERRDDVADDLGDLTRDIREARFHVEWGPRPSARR